MLAYGEGKFTISKQLIKLAINDTEAAEPIPSKPWLSWALPVFICAIVTTTLFVHGNVGAEYQDLVSLVKEWRK